MLVTNGICALPNIKQIIIKKCEVEVEHRDVNNYRNEMTFFKTRRVRKAELHKTQINISCLEKLLETNLLDLLFYISYI